MLKMNMILSALSIAIYLGSTTTPCLAEEHSEGSAGLAQALKEAKISLEKGLSASQTSGKPISAKFEL